MGHAVLCPVPWGQTSTLHGAMVSCTWASSQSRRWTSCLCHPRGTLSAREAQQVVGVQPTCCVTPDRPSLPSGPHLGRGLKGLLGGVRDTIRFTWGLVLRKHLTRELSPYTFLELSQLPCDMGLFLSPPV